MLVPCVLMLATPRMIVGLYLDLTAPANQGTAAIAVRLSAGGRCSAESTR
jgi:hypothetical protein